LHINKASKSEISNSSDIKVDTVFIRDTIFVEKKTSISDDLYFSIRSIHYGGNWEKENDDYSYYYKILECSVEETGWIEIEEIRIIYDGKIELVKREKIQPSVFGLEYDTSISLIKWISPKVVRFSIWVGKWEQYDLDISNMRGTHVN